MAFEWNEAAAFANLRNHRVDFADVLAVFEDAAAVTIPDQDCADKEQWVTIGADAFNRLLVVVYAWRGTNIKLISARRASRRERIEHGR